jgi:hypothetical protein
MARKVRTEWIEGAHGCEEGANAREGRSRWIGDAYGGLGVRTAEWRYAW